MAVTGCQGNGKKIRMFYKAAILSIKHYVHINDSRSIETRHSQLSNDALNVKIGSQETKISSIEFAFV